MDLSSLILPAAVLGPAVAGIVWAALSRWMWPRRIAGVILALGAHAAAWAVLWQAYRGDPPAWRSLEVTLLGASVLVACEVAVGLSALRADGLGRRAAVGAIPALAVSTTAVAYESFTTSMVVQALFLPVVTVASAVAALSGGRRRDLAGILGLAAADVAALAGLAVVVLRSGSVVVAAPGGELDLGPLLLLAGAAVKAGAVPGVGTWRLAATGGAGAPLAAVLRGQAVALAVLAGVVVAGAPGSLSVAAAAGALALTAGVGAATSRRPAAVAAGLAGVAGAVTLLALGLGGAVGVRSFLLSFPPFLLASGALFVASWEGDPPVGRGEGRGAPSQPRGDAAPSAGWHPRRWLAGAAVLVAALSLAGLPPGGGHPGTALALDLAGIRAQADPAYLAIAGAAALGLGVGALSVVPLLFRSRPSLPAAAAGTAAGAMLLYMGAQPVRLGVGWWLRIERELGVPELLPSAGAPRFPSVDGLDLGLALVPAAVLTLALVAAGRGRLRGPVPASGPSGARTRLRLPRPLRRATAGGALVAGAVRARAQRLALGLAAAALLEAVAVGLSAYLVVQGVRLGFL